MGGTNIGWSVGEVVESRYATAILDVNGLEKIGCSSYADARPGCAMAKSDSFFIRARAEFNGTTFAQTAIDTGAYVDALGKSVLRIHRLAVCYGDAMQSVGIPPGNVTGLASFQLTTQSQAAMVNLDDKSVIASGKLNYAQDANGPQFISDQLDLSPQAWRNGYLVGVEQLYLGVDQSSVTDFSAVSIVMECTVETLSQSAAMALALSQQ